MRRTLIFLISPILAIGGCHSLPQPMNLPAQVRLPQTMRLPDAHEITVGQLVFHSDFELPADHRLVRELIAERDDVLRTIQSTGSKEAIDVYLFRDAERYQQFLKYNFPNVPSRRAFFLETDTRLAVYAHWSDRVAEDLRHEVAHGYMHSVVPKIPLWLDEGLAEYFEVPHALAGLNSPHVELLSDMAAHENWQPNLARLEKLTEAAQMDQRDYAESWAWVYFFLNSPPTRREVLTGYLVELRTRGAAEPLSTRIAALDVEPGRPMAEYVASLKRNAVVR